MSSVPILESAPALKQKVICAANARAHEEQQKTKDKENKIIWSEGTSRPISRSESSVQVKIARKNSCLQPTKEELRRNS